MTRSLNLVLFVRLAEGATFATRAAARRLAGRGGELEAARLRALLEARRAAQ